MEPTEEAVGLVTPAELRAVLVEAMRRELERIFNLVDGTIIAQALVDAVLAAMPPEFDNHHNAARCPYCSQALLRREVAAEIRSEQMVRVIGIAVHNWRQAGMQGTLDAAVLDAVATRIEGST